MNKRRAGAVLLVVALFVGAAFAQSQEKAKDSRTSQKGWLGVSIQDITPQLKRSMDLQSTEGALVSEVSDESPADSAGVKEGDVIITFDGKNIEDASDLQAAVGKTKPGTKVSLVLVRKGEKKSIQLTVGKAPREKGLALFTPKDIPQVRVFVRSGLFGLKLMELNDQLAEYFGVPEGEGVLVEEVEKKSGGDKAGIKAGDVILQIGKKRIDEVRDVGRALSAYDEGEKAEIEVLRKGARKTLSLEIEEEEDAADYRFWMAPKQPRKLREFHFNEIPDFDLDIPHIEIDHVGPDLDALRSRLESLREGLHDRQLDVRRHIERVVRPRVRHTITEVI